MAVSKSKKVNTLNLNLSKNWLLKGWEEISRDGNENQLTIKIGHINPEEKADPLLTGGSQTATVNGEAVSVHSISTRGTMTKFFETMTKMAASGWMQGYTPEMIQQLRGQFNKVQNEKYDTSSDVTITRYPDEKSAAQALQNQILIKTEGLGAVVIPGTDGKMQNYFENEAVKKFMTKEQVDLLKKMVPKMKEQQKEAFQKTGMKYFVGEYLGHSAAMMEMDNPDYKRFIAPKPKPPSRDPHAFHGGGFDPLAGKGVLPKRPLPQPPPKIIKSCLAVQIGNYLLTGSLLYGMEMLPSGNTFCEALTKYKIYVETEQVEGQTYTTKHIVPVESTYAAEGYVNKEEVEKMLADIIKVLT